MKTLKTKAVQKETFSSSKNFLKVDTNIRKIL